MIGNGPAGFGRAASEKDPQGHLAGVVPRRRCHPGAIERRWTRELVISAMLEWRERYGRLPSSYDWSRTHARRRGEHALRRLAEGHWPAASVVTAVFGTWAVARQAAAEKRPGDRAPTEQYDRGLPEPPDRVRARPDEPVGAVAAADRLDRPATTADSFSPPATGRGASCANSTRSSSARSPRRGAGSRARSTRRARV